MQEGKDHAPAGREFGQPLAPAVQPGAMHAVRLLRSLIDCLVSVNQSSDEDGVDTGNPWEPVGTQSDDEDDAEYEQSAAASTRAQLPATPTEVDPSTGNLVATTAMGVKHWYRTHTAMGTPIAPAGYPGETAEQEATHGHSQTPKRKGWHMGYFPQQMVWCEAL